MAFKASLKRKAQNQSLNFDEQPVSSNDNINATNNNNDYVSIEINSTKVMKCETSDDIGRRLMSKMGYKEGQGLGKHSQGDVNVIQESNQKGRRGLGYQLSAIEVDKQYEWNPEKEKQFINVNECVYWLPECEQELPNIETLKTWSLEAPKKMTLNDETNFCDNNILKGILECKDVFDSLSGPELRKARSQSNPFETVEKGMFQNRAAMKMANIDTIFDFMFTEPMDENKKSLVKPSELLYFADICAGPGGFSEYVLYKKGWHSKGFGFTLKGANDFKLEDFFAGSPETFEPHYGMDDDGDIYKPQNLISFRDYVLKNTDGGVHFVMADGGFSVEGQENIQEIMSKRLYLCQFVCALAILRQNGSFVCKLFDIFTPFSVGLIYLMYRAFKHVSIHKPNSSRPANSERYIVCKWKRSGTIPMEQYLFAMNCELDLLTRENSKQDIVEIVPLSILKQDKQFYDYICESNKRIGECQILYLSKVKAFAENPDLIEERQFELKKESLIHWKIPAKARVAPSRSDPFSKFKDLISKSNSVSDYFAFKPKMLSHDNFRNELSNVHEFKCMILGAENDSLQSISLNNLTSIRGYFLGMGRQNIYYWDGSSSSKWIKFEVRLELPPETLIYGEQVQELQGESRAQKKISAFHIIDILFIGGKDYRDICFEERLALANKLAKAVTKCTQTEYAAIRVKQVYDLVNFQYIFNNMDMRECKSGAKKDRLCYDIIYSANRFIIPYGLLIINTVKKPWICKWSRSGQKPYFFNVKTNKSTFDFPSEALADYKHTFSNRIIWKWESDAALFDNPINTKQECLDRCLINNFIDDMKFK